MQIAGKEYILQINKAPHDLATIVDEIIKVTGTTKTYGYKYWLRKVKTSKLSYNEILSLVEKARTLQDKYSKGGFLTKRI